MPRTHQLDEAQLAINLAKLPEHVFVTNEWVAADGLHGRPPVLYIVRGEEGYNPIYTDLTADQLNADYPISVTSAQASAMVNGSMFGWDTRSADPDDKINQPEGTP